MRFQDNEPEVCSCCDQVMSCDLGGVCHQCSVDCTPDHCEVKEAVAVKA